MDIDAIARKVRELGRDLPQGNMTPDELEVRHIKAILDAAGVPELEAQCAAFREALEAAVKVIRTWHGMDLVPTVERQMWDTYRLNAPEMRPIRDALDNDAGRDFLAQKQAAEKVCEAAKVFIEDEGPCVARRLVR